MKRKRKPMTAAQKKKAKAKREADKKAAAKLEARLSAAKEKAAAKEAAKAASDAAKAAYQANLDEALARFRRFAGKVSDAWQRNSKERMHHLMRTPRMKVTMAKLPADQKNWTGRYLVKTEGLSTR